MKEYTHYNRIKSVLAEKNKTGTWLSEQMGRNLGTVSRWMTNMANEIVETKAIEQVSDSLYKGVSDIIDNARQEVVVYVNKHSDLMFWHIGHYINEDMGYKQYSAYGSRILATLSQRLTARYGKGYTYTAVTRMMKVARFYSDEEMFATLSQTLTWSHFLELVTIEDNNKRLFCHKVSDTL